MVVTNICLCVGPVCFLRAGRRLGFFFLAVVKDTMLLSIFLEFQKRLV